VHDVRLLKSENTTENLVQIHNTKNSPPEFQAVTIQCIFFLPFP